MRPAREHVFVLLLALLLPGASWAQTTGSVTGTITSAASGEPLPGVNVLVEGTQQGTATDANGTYRITGIEAGTYTVRASFVGYGDETEEGVEVTARDSTTVDLVMQQEATGLDEVVVVGYGTQQRKDLTGSISSAQVDEVAPTDVSVMQSLQGSIPGLSVGQVDEAGESPNILIRGRTSLSGAEAPLIVVDDVVYRGNITDLNPNNIESIDVLKDASAAAVYGSQAANGVIVITTKKSGSTVGEGPTVTFSSQAALQEPWRELRAQSPEAFMEKIVHSDLEQARTEESGYTERNPDWAETTNFKTNHEVEAFEAGQAFDWYEQVTANTPYTTKQNISVANQTETSNYFVSGGVTRQQGYVRDEGYTRLNARANLGSEVTDWLDIDFQSFVTVSRYDPQMYTPFDRYIEPYAHPYEIEDGGVTGTLVQRPYGNPPNPLIEAQSDSEDRRLNLNGTVVFNVALPVEGLSYQGNVYNSYRTNSDYFFGPHVSNFQGGGHKNYSRSYDLTSDHVLNFERTLADVHDVDVTLLFGLERRSNNYTNASASNFARQVLGYNRLQDGASDQQTVDTGGWQESSLYSMGRLQYVFDDKYLLTATLRRDGFSGFSEEHKWGYFPSVAVGWVLTEESFFDGIDWLGRLKLRASYGTVGNRTIGRYQTLAKVDLGAGYVDAAGSSMLTQHISALASPSLRWERTTGIDIGIDYNILNGRISGTFDYYNKNTTNLLYEVDIPAMTGFETFPDNLGRIHNHGIEMEISSANIRRPEFEWSTDLVFSRNRNSIDELLGFDVDGDGREDDLVSEGLFIGEPLSAIYDYEIDGLWQMGEDIPDGYEFGSYKVVDRNGDGEITPDDRTIVGATAPAYRFGIRNNLRYQNWSLSFFINSVQGGGDRYLGEDTLYGLGIFNNETHFNRTFPAGLDYWTPSNTDARYQRPGISGASGLAGTRYAPRSFIRLQNARLQYRFNTGFLQGWGANNLDVYISGRNLITLTNWNGWDPETGAGIDNSSRPVMRAYSIGLNLTL